MKIIIYCPTGKLYLPFGRDFFIREATELANATFDDPICEVIEERTFTPRADASGIDAVICRRGNGTIIGHFASIGVEVLEIGGTFVPARKPRPTSPVEKPIASPKKVNGTGKENQSPSFSQIGTVPLDQEECDSAITRPMLHIIIGIRIHRDDTVRMVNLEACLNAFNDQTADRSSFAITLIEESPSPMIPWSMKSLTDFYSHIGSSSPFNRSRAFNSGVRFLRPAKSSILCLADADLLPDRDFVKRSMGMCYCADVLIPYDVVKYLTKPSSIWARRDRGGNGQFATWKYDGVERSSHGGVIFVGVNTYLELGGHNEAFEGWGCEDSDFILRALRRHTVKRGNSVMLHMHHEKAERGDVSKKNLAIYLSEHPYINSAKGVV